MPPSNKTIYDRARDLLSDGRARKPAEIAATLGEPMKRVTAIRERLKAGGMKTEGRSRWSTWVMPLFPNQGVAAIPDAAAKVEDDDFDDFAIVIDDRMEIGIYVGGVKVRLTQAHALRAFTFLSQVEPMLTGVEE